MEKSLVQARRVNDLYMATASLSDCIDMVSRVVQSCLFVEFSSGFSSGSGISEISTALKSRPVCTP